jgi:hypothetical protein
MKKISLVIAAAFLFTGLSFAQGGENNTKKKRRKTRKKTRRKTKNLSNLHFLNLNLEIDLRKPWKQGFLFSYPS